MILRPTTLIREFAAWFRRKEQTIQTPVVTPATIALQRLVKAAGLLLEVQGLTGRLAPYGVQQEAKDAINEAKKVLE